MWSPAGENGFACIRKPEAKRYISLTREITSPGIFPDLVNLKIFSFAHFPGRLRDSTLPDIEFSETSPCPKDNSIARFFKRKDLTPSLIRGVTRVYFGQRLDIPIPGDYGGGAADEIAIFRPGGGLWAVKGVTRAYYGRDGDIPLGQSGLKQSGNFFYDPVKWAFRAGFNFDEWDDVNRSEEHTSELQSHSFISYAVFCLKKKTSLSSFSFFS